MYISCSGTCIVCKQNLQFKTYYYFRNTIKKEVIVYSNGLFILKPRFLEQQHFFTNAQFSSRPPNLYISVADFTISTTFQIRPLMCFHHARYYYCKCAMILFSIAVKCIYVFIILLVGMQHSTLHKNMDYIIVYINIRVLVAELLLR